MRHAALALIALALLCACNADAGKGTAAKTTAAQPDTSAEDVGFQQYYKCPTLPGHLGDLKTPTACLAACKKVPGVTGCEWKDGSGGFPRECRACTGASPVKGNWANDWALSLP